MENICIAGFDPASTRNLGWSFIDFSADNKVNLIETGTFVMPACETQWHSLWPIFTIIDQFLSDKKPDIVIVEKTSSFRGSFITGQISHCMGVILAACGKHQMDVSFVYPTHVKKVITGNGRATKSHMKKGVLERLTSFGVSTIKFKSEHSVDATGNILCWLLDNQLSQDEESKGE